MDWIFSHMQIVIAIAGGIAWLLKQRGAGQAQSGGDEPLTEGKTFADPELAERTRRIREEIQRKIEQRARGYAGGSPAPARPEPAAPPPMIAAGPAPAPAPPARLAADRTAEVLEEQRTLMAKLQEARQMEEAARKRTAFEQATADHMAAARVEARTSVLEDLQTPDALRRAFILREVLGPPVALRG